MSPKEPLEIKIIPTGWNDLASPESVQSLYFVEFHNLNKLYIEVIPRNHRVDRL